MSGRGVAALAVIGLLGLSALACADVTSTFNDVREGVAAASAEATRERLSCDADVDMPDIDGCLSGRLSCGDVVTGTTVGGEAAMGDDFYASQFCLPSGDDYSGSERVYLFEAPARQDVRVKLTSDCVDLDLVAVAWNYDGRCPTENHRVPECEASATRGGGTLRLNTFNARDYLLIVDGKHRATGTFRLEVECGNMVR